MVVNLKILNIALLLGIVLCVLAIPVIADTSYLTANDDVSYEKVGESSGRIYTVMGFDISSHSVTDTITNATLDFNAYAVEGDWTSSGNVRIALVPNDDWNETAGASVANASYYARINETNYTGPSGTGTWYANITTHYAEAVSRGLDKLTLIITTDKGTYFDIDHTYSATGEDTTYVMIADFSEYLAIYTSEHTTASEKPHVNVTFTPAAPSNNAPDAPTLNAPSDGATGQATSVVLNITVSDPDGDDMNITFLNATDNSTICTNNSISNGSIVTCTWSGRSYSTTYQWFVNVTDNNSASTLSSTWNFTTQLDPALTISECMTLDQAGVTYTMNQSISDSSSDKCINVTAQNITVDCNGFTIDGTDQSWHHGIYTNQYNTTIENCHITDWFFGIFVDQASHATIRDSTFDSNDITASCGIALDFGNYTEIDNITATNGQYGILNDESWNVHVNNSVVENMSTIGMFFDMDPDHSIIENSNFTNCVKGMEWNYADNVTFRNNIITGSGTCFIINHWAECSASDYSQNCSEWDSYDNYIYNNFFNCTTFLSNGPGYNVSDWNVSKQAGNNIFNSSNPNIGGNYYANYSGSGFSDTCTDADNDGFCDNSYTILTGNIDYLPISDEYSPNDDTSPTITITSPLNTTYTTLPINFNVTVNEPASWCGYNLGGNNVTLSNDSTTNWFGQNNSLVDGTTYQLIVYCNDTSGNVGMNDSIWFTYNTTDVTAPYSNNPSDATYDLNDDASIPWELYDESAGGYYIIYRNGTVQNSSTSWSMNGPNPGTYVNINTTTQITATLSHYRAICRDNESNIHMAYRYNISAIMYSKSTDNGSTWTSTIFQNAGAVMYAPSIACDDGNVYISYDDTTYLNYNVLVSNDHGDSWNAYVALNYSVSGCEPYKQSPMVANSGVVYMSFVWRDASLKGHIGIINSTDYGVTWSNATSPVVDAIDPSLSGSCDSLDHPQMAVEWNAVNGYNRIHVVANCITDGVSGLYYGRSANNGSSFDTPVLLGNITGEHPGVAFNGSNVWVVADNQSTAIIFYESKDNGTTWTETQIDPADGYTYDEPAIGIGKNGYPIVVFEYDNDLAYMAYDGNYWGNIHNITTDGNSHVSPVIKQLYDSDAQDLFWISGAGSPYNISYSIFTFDGNASVNAWVNTTTIGTWNYTIAFNDTSGNSNNDEVIITIQSGDSAPPTITIDSPLNQTYSTSDIWFNVTVNENISTCFVDYGDGNKTMSNTSMTAWYHNNVSVVDGTHQAIFWCNDTSGNSNSTSIYFTVDTTAPTISSVSAGSITSSSAIITWTTNELANSSLSISPSATYSNSSSNTTSHSISLTGLSASTLYTYTVQSCDPYGNCANSSGNTFTSSATDVGSGGGGECNATWVCTTWSECQEDGTQTRTCTDSNNCGDFTDKPDESRICIPDVPPPLLNFTGNWTWEWPNISMPGVYNPTRFAAVISSLMIGDIGAVIMHTVASFGDYYYRPAADWGIMSFIFMHITVFIGLYVLLGLIIRASGMLKKLSTTFKGLVYFIILPFIVLFITLILPSV